MIKLDLTNLSDEKQEVFRALYVVKEFGNLYQVMGGYPYEDEFSEYNRFIINGKDLLLFEDSEEDDETLNTLVSMYNKLKASNFKGVSIFVHDTEEVYLCNSVYEFFTSFHYLGFDIFANETFEFDTMEYQGEEEFELLHFGIQHEPLF